MRQILLGAAAFAACATLAACSQQQPAPTPPPQTVDGGYGPFGADAPSQQPQQQPIAPVFTPDQGGGAERVLSGGGMNAPPEFQRLMTTILDGYGKQMANGWPSVGGVGDVITSLNVGGEHVVDVALRGGRSYAFIGACDNECDDVDLVLENISGSAVDDDVLPDDYPLVEVTPRADGAYRLRIRLKTCTVAPCYVAARLVYQP